MKNTRKAALGLFLFLFVLGMSTAKASTPDWGVRGGDVIRWDATHYQNNIYITSTLEWYVIVTVDGFPEFNGMNYINGSINQNDTIIDDPVSISPVTLRSLGHSAGAYLGPQLNNITLGTNLISDSVELAGLKAGFQGREDDHPFLNFTETVPNESFRLFAHGTEVLTEYTYDWTFNAVVNYTSDKVLYSVDEDYYQVVVAGTGLGNEAFDEYEWRRTSYVHGTGDLPPDDNLDIPGYGVPILLGTLIIGTVILVRKHKLS